CAQSTGAGPARSAQRPRCDRRYNREVRRMNSEHEYRPVLEALKAAADNAFVEQNTFVACELDVARATVAELIESLDWALLRIRTSLDMGEQYERAAAVLARCKGGAA